MRGVTTLIIRFMFGLIFQLTRLMRGVTNSLRKLVRCFGEFQLTRLMRGVTRLQNR